MNYYVWRYFYLSRKVKKIVSISDCLFIAEEIGFDIGFLTKDKSLIEEVKKRIHYKFLDLTAKVHLRAFEIYNKG